MASPTRLGDLLRVVHELHPGADQVAVIAELLPRDPRHGVAATHVPTRRSAPRPLPPPATPTEPGQVPDPARRPRSRLWLRRGDDGRSLRLFDPDLWDERWRSTVALAATLLAALMATGRLDPRPGLTMVVALVAARHLWWYASRGWSAWWRSAQRRSSADHSDLRDPGGEGDGGDATGGVTLVRARWQPPPQSRPLVRTGQQRAVATLLAGRVTSGDIDLAAAVRRLASRQTLTEVPRRARWSTNQGMQLHVDTGPALDPFHHDVEQLRRALVAIASPHAVVELGFDGDPNVLTWPRHVVGPRGRLDLADRLPPPGTPVLVVTDLGIAVARSGSPAEPEDLLHHHDLLTRAGCRVQYLVPYPLGRWPAALTALPILHWCDDLGAGDVLAGLRRRVRP